MSSPILLCAALLAGPVGPTIGVDGQAIDNAVAMAMKRQPDFRAVVLPDGEPLTPLSLQLGDPQRLFPYRTPAAVQRAANNQVIAIYAHSNGRLDGASAGFYPDGTLQAIVPYRDGRRHGTMWLWDDKGLLEYRGEYIFGRHHGRVVLFSGGRPWFTAEVDDGVVTASHAILFSKHGAPRLRNVLGDERTANDDLLFWAAVKKISEIEGPLSENEPHLRRALSQWWRDVKRNKVSQLAPVRRAAQSARRKATQAARDATFDRLRDRHKIGGPQRIQLGRLR